MKITFSILFLTLSCFAFSQKRNGIYFCDKDGNKCYSQNDTIYIKDLDWCIYFKTKDGKDVESHLVESVIGPKRTSQPGIANTLNYDQIELIKKCQKVKFTEMYRKDNKKKVHDCFFWVR